MERVIEVSDGRIIASGRFDTPYTEGHFPDQPIVPGVALLEGLAQTMGCLVRIASPDATGVPLLAGFDRVRFRAPVIPPVEMRYEVVIQERRMGITRASGKVWCGDKRVCTAQLMGAKLRAQP